MIKSFLKLSKYTPLYYKRNVRYQVQLLPARDLELLYTVVTVNGLVIHISQFFFHYLFMFLRMFL